MLLQFIFAETSPSAPGTAASSQYVQSAASYLAAGIAGPLDESFGIQITAVLKGATGGTLDVYIQTSPNDGVTWVDAVHFPQLAAGAASVLYVATLSAISQPASASPVVVGAGLSPALAANTVVQGLGFNRLRLLFVAGSGTTAGAPISAYVIPQRAGTH
jgi:hypothetical protein